MDAVYDRRKYTISIAETKYILENISDYDETKSYVVNVFH